MNRSAWAAMAAVASLGLATMASAETVVSLGNNTLTGGQSNSYGFVLEGTLTSFLIEFDYVSNTGGSWASDMVLKITDPNAFARYWGGFNLNPGGTNSGLWGFDGPASANSGFYFDTKSVAGMSGTGTWTLEIFNGWTTSPEVQYNNVTVTLTGLVPAPGAIALLGLAGLAGSRRRRG